MRLIPEQQDQTDNPIYPSQHDPGEETDCIETQTVGLVSKLPEITIKL